MEELFDKYPMVIQAFAIIGFIRTINKPLFSFLRSITAATASPADDAILDEVERSKAYKYVSYILDWSLSVKLPK